jgi:serine/threonine protein kinase
MTNCSRSKSIDESKMGGGSRDEKEGIELRLRINEHATKVVAERFQNGTLPDHSSRFPKFSLQDVVKGKYLGKGNFGTVFEVLALDGRALSLHQLDRSRRKKWYMGRALSSPVLPMDPEIEEIDDENYDLNSECEENGNDEETISAQNVESRLKTKQEAAKAFMREHCLRETNKKPRYAIKILRPEVLDDPTTLYFQGIMDMATEARLLSSIQHPHVIKLRGVGHEPCTEKFFLILDRLYQTLDQRWKQWQKAHRRYSFLWGSLDCRGDKRAWMWQERIVCAHDLASGLAHLHSRNIIHRDIKSDNIGFDVRGDVKVSPTKRMTIIT